MGIEGSKGNDAPSTRILVAQWVALDGPVSRKGLAGVISQTFLVFRIYHETTFSKGLSQMTMTRGGMGYCTLSPMPGPQNPTESDRGVAAIVLGYRCNGATNSEHKNPTAAIKGSKGLAGNIHSCRPGGFDPQRETKAAEPT